MSEIQITLAVFSVLFYGHTLNDPVWPQEECTDSLPHFRTLQIKVYSQDLSLSILHELQN